MSAKELKKELSSFDVFCVCTGAMISSGLFILPGIAFAKAGPAIIISYLLAALLCIPTLMSKAELTTAMPKAGGDYFYIMRGFGSMLGTIAGFCSWISLSLKSAFALLGMSAYLHLVIHWPLSYIALACCLFFVVLNLVGVKEASRLQAILVTGLLGILTIYISLGIQSINYTHFTPFFSKNSGSIFATASMIFISFGGLTKVAAIAEETKSPGKTLPQGMFWAFVVTTIFYIAVISVTVGVLPPLQLQNNITPISDSARVFGGRALQWIVSIAAFLAFVSTANAGIMTSSRYPLAMSRDKLLPPIFKKISTRFQVPYMSVILTGSIIGLAIFFLKLEAMAKVASSILILLFILANMVLILFRESKIPDYNPKFKTPLYPLLQIIGIIGGIFLLIEMGTKLIFLMSLFLLGGFLWYKIYVGTNAAHGAALIHVLDRLIIRDRHKTSDDLMGDLKKTTTEQDPLLSDEHFLQVTEGILVNDLGSANTREDLANSLTKTVFHAAKNIDINNYLHQNTHTILDNSIVIYSIPTAHISHFRIIVSRSQEGIAIDNKKSYIFFVLLFPEKEHRLKDKVSTAINKLFYNDLQYQEWLEEILQEDLKNFLSDIRHHLIKAFKNS